MDELMGLINSRMVVLLKKQEIAQACRNYYAICQIDDEVEFLRGLRLLMESIDIDKNMKRSGTN